MFTDDEKSFLENYHKQKVTNSNSDKALKNYFRKVKTKDIDEVDVIHIKPQLYSFDKVYVKMQEDKLAYNKSKIRFLNTEAFTYCNVDGMNIIELINDEDVVSIKSLSTLDDGYTSIHLLEKVKVVKSEKGIYIAKL